MTRLPSLRILALSALGLVAAIGLTSCGTSDSLSFGSDTRNKMIVSVRDQKMMLVRDGAPLKTYKISTSKFGIGDRPGSNCTPLGRLQVAKKIGANAPIGSVFKSRRQTGEVLKPNAPGRDPIVTRILWLSGTESRNQNAFRRTIYIHGTPEERRLGSPASYGCIRMGSNDVADLYNRIGTGADVFIIRGSIQSENSETESAFAGKSTFRPRS
ncbi:L,D-transpeptidase [Luteolibacter yonseiensis]|uniref:L,D-transpeptidase n=1 Tax=Luteolibacter yonseiensis TaxID=1144680 RepID=A0A934R754_9BACT|nr:L,D-transpeptidase [Luteolibacter yonseiensis]MBK1816334.1 L,D-transpeptidase [Luteolibacter yonseiensis]